jgi:hypothetical protein
LWYIWSGDIAPQKSLPRIEDTLHDGNPAQERKAT